MPDRSIPIQDVRAELGHDQNRFIGQACHPVFLCVPGVSEQPPTALRRIDRILWISTAWVGDLQAWAVGDSGERRFSSPMATKYLRCRNSILTS